jgi:hypothetical protein
MNYFNFTSFEGTSEPPELIDDAFDFALRAFNNSQSLLEEARELPKAAPRPILYGVDTLDVSKPLLIDKNGNEANRHKISDALIIRSIVSNKIDQKINFTAIIQIKDNNGFTSVLTSLKGMTISPHERAEPSLSWMPENAGEFSIEIFLWTELNDPTPLAPVQTASIVLVG